MALNSRGAIDPRWLTHNQAIGYGLQLATVEVYNTGASEQSYDVATNTWTDASTTMYTGPARIQPVNAASESNEDYNPTTLQAVRVVLPYGKNTLAGSDGAIPDIRPNDRLKVTESPYNAVLASFGYVVVSVLNSSNAWERTLLCRVDMELDPTNA